MRVRLLLLASVLAIPACDEIAGIAVHTVAEAGDSDGGAESGSSSEDAGTGPGVEAGSAGGAEPE